MLLAIDTAGAFASLAIYDLGMDQVLAEMTWQARQRHTQDLLVVAQNLLRLAGLSPQELTALAITTGPGSFTGVRLGVSVAKGIGIGLPTPPRIVGMPTLSVTAAPWVAAAEARQTPTAICACLQAGRGRFNWAWFAGGDRLHRPRREDHAAGSADELVAALAARTDASIWLVGETSRAVADGVDSLANVALVDAACSPRRAGWLACAAALHLEIGSVDTLESLQPLYLRSL